MTEDIKKMRFGFVVSLQYPRGEAAKEFAERLRLARLARSLGFASFWTNQHFLAAPYQMLQPMPALGRLSAELPGARLGCVVLLPLFPPVLLAEELASLDIISDGRLDVALALGYRDIENDALGSPARQRVGRFNEGLQILKGLWSGEPFHFDGRYHHVPECQSLLLPVQRPHPPLWIAANNDRAIERAAQHGDAWLIAPHSPLSVVKRQMAVFQAARTAADLPFPTVIPIRRDAYVAPTVEEAHEHAERYLGARYETYRQWGQDRALPTEDRFSEDFSELSSDRFLIGTPEQVRADLERYRSAIGVTDVILRLDPADMPLELVERSLRLFGNEVLPAFASA